MLSTYMENLVERLVELCAPEQIFIFSAKVNLANEVTGFKLCVIAHTTDKYQLEQKIYLTLDCEIPYDVVVYTDEEWQVYSNSNLSFAQSIREKGRLIYDKTKK